MGHWLVSWWTTRSLWKKLVMLKKLNGYHLRKFIDTFWGTTEQGIILRLWKNYWHYTFHRMQCKSKISFPRLSLWSFSPKTFGKSVTNTVRGFHIHSELWNQIQRKAETFYIGWLITVGYERRTYQKLNAVENYLPLHFKSNV